MRICNNVAARTIDYLAIGFSIIYAKIKSKFLVAILRKVMVVKINGRTRFLCAWVAFCQKKFSVLVETGQLDCQLRAWQLNKFTIIRKCLNIQDA